jgi:tetratricopeptide (TPR) repeat protein
VLAVWGSPVAAEGDAERAVGAGLDVLAAVAELGVRIVAPGLGARAGVVTGTVATTPGAEGQAMVAGDAVNTAARVQSAAPPGAVLVDTTTRRLVAAAIELELHGDVELKGKAAPETLWRATQVVSGIGGAQRGDGLEGPFVGRTVEFRLVKDLLHATTLERRPHLVLVSGPPGVGKTRLGWELEKYVDGLAEAVFWHRGRCPRFGEDTAYWALAEIVRARLGVAEDDDLEVIEDKLARSLHDLFEDDADREVVGTRLARLLGLPGAGRDATLAQSELFAGWRAFFEALARQRTVLLLIEDLHDADEGLLDFVEHLVDWVRDLPVLVIGFARPELGDRRPGLASGRSRSTITLAPLGESAMRELLAGLVHRLPPAAVEAIEAQAQGIPLFAVETVRSLIDRHVVEDTGGGYVLTGSLGELSVPETLHALLASRLDALDPVARSLAGDAAVIAAPFTADLLHAVSTLEAGQVDAGLAELTRRDVLSVSADALSSHVGSHGFTHGLLAQVAYQTLSRRDLKDRHLRIAAHLEASPRNDGDALAEVIAWHHLDALKARPNDADVDVVRADALAWLDRAGERAGSTGAHPTAARLYSSAAELVGDGDEQRALRAADLWMSAGRASLFAGDWTTAVDAATRAGSLRAAYGHERLVALAEGLRGRATVLLGRPDEARTLLRDALTVLEREPGPDTVALMNELSAAYSLSGQDEADELGVRALVLGQELGVDDLLVADLLINRGVFLTSRDRPVESVALFREAQRRAEAAGSLHHQVRACLNIGDAISWVSPAESLTYSLEAARLARQGGFRYYLGYGLANVVLCSLLTGDWARADEVSRTLMDEEALTDMAIVPPTVAIVRGLRGDPDGGRAALEATTEAERDPQERAYLAYARAVLAFVTGDREAAALALDAATTSARVGLHSDVFVASWPLAARTAHETGDDAATATLLGLIEDRHRGTVPPLVRAERLLTLARPTADPVDRVAAIEEAVGELRAVGSPYHVALALLDLAAAHQDADKSAADVLAEASSIGTVLGAPHVVERAERLRTRRT